MFSWATRNIATDNSRFEAEVTSQYNKQKKLT
jgi:hypothetical protein